MNIRYELNFPAKIVFGCATATTLREYLPSDVKRIIIVAGSHVISHGVLDSILMELNGYEVSVFSGIATEPSPSESDKIVQAGRAFDADALIAIGGGSVIDAAKAAAAIMPLEGICDDYFSGKRIIEGKGVFFVALPTTAGTGAEITNNSVLTDPETKVKKSLRSQFMTADLALIDPVLTLSCPPSLTAGSGLDAFVQAVESYTSIKANSTTRAFATEAVRKIYFNLRTAYNYPEDLNARTELAEGSMLSAMSFSQCGLGAIHGLAHPIGSLLKLPHGIACAILMPYIFEWNMPACEREFAFLAELCGLPPDALSFVKGAYGLSSALQTPINFSAYGLDKTHYEFIVKNCRSNSMSLNPRPMSDDDVLALLEKLT